MTVVRRADSLYPDVSVHPACIKHRPAAGIGGMEQSPKGSDEAIGTTAFPQSTGINSLVIVNSQGRVEPPTFRFSAWRSWPSKIIKDGSPDQTGHPGDGTGRLKV